MDYTHQVFDSIEGVDRAAWDEVCDAHAAGIFMDRRVLAALESGMREECRFRYLIFFDADGRPVCCTCLSTFSLDLANVVHPRVAAFIRRLPAIVSPLTTFRILFCGVPLSAGQTSLAFAPRCDRALVLAQLDQVASRIARLDRARIVTFKEFDQHDADGMGILSELGYRRFESPPMHSFPAAFRSLDEYCAALRSEYRSEIVHSRKKLARHGVTISFISDAHEMLRILTPQMHRLYLDVVQRSDVKLETLTEAFFRALIRHAGPNVRLVVLAKDEHVIAFSWHLQTDTTVHMLFGGISYELNADLDLYFNLMYASLDFALRQGVSEIHVGQTAGVFKSRLGCDVAPRYMFAKGLHPFMAWIVHNVLVKLIPKPDPLPAFHIYRASEGRDATAP